MSEHEFWNELGNLYFISGAYEPAIHAYARSIELDHGYGRPYSNMALAFVHTGNFQDAIELYHRSIELLTDPKEKAITWNRLGILYRQIKDYQGALVAYEQADKLDARQDDKREQASREVKYPLSVTMPPIDLQAILDRKQGEEPVDESHLQNVNDELQAAQSQHEVQWFDGDFVPPDPLTEPAAEEPAAEADPLPQVPLSVEEELLRDISLSMVEEGWIPMIRQDAIPFTEIQMDSGTSAAQDGNPGHFTDTWQTTAGDPVQDEQSDPAGLSASNEGTTSEYQRVEVKGYQSNEEADLPREAGQGELKEDQSTHENQWTELSADEIVEEFGLTAEADPMDSSHVLSEVENHPLMRNQDPGNEGRDVLQVESSIGEVLENQPQFENISVMVVRQSDSGIDSDPQTGEAVTEAAVEDPLTEAESFEAGAEMEVTEPETFEYSQVEYPLIELTPAEIDSIEIDIARFKRIIQINPRNAFAWDTVGGLYKALGRFKDAITSYQQAIALDSTKPSYYYQLGLMYSAEKRDQEAVDAFQRVLSVDPNHILAHASLGNYYRKMGLNDLAQHHIDIALKDVYEEENEYNQACLEAICGNTERALELLQVAIEDNPSYVNWAQHDPDLDTLRQDQRFYMLIHQHAPVR